MREQRCSICGDPEPVHAHNGDTRIEDFFTVGRGETDFEAAQRWRRRALRAEAGLAGNQERKMKLQASLLDPMRARSKDQEVGG